MAFIFGSSGGGGGTPGGSSGQVQYNNAGAFGGFTTGGDLTLVTATGAYTLAKIAGTTLTISSLAAQDILQYNGVFWANTALSALGLVVNVQNSDGTIGVSMFSGTATVSLALSHANTWTGQQTFNTSAPIFGTTTLGSVHYSGTSGILSQDNANFFYDGTNHTLGLGTTRSGAQSSSNAALKIQTGVVGAMELQLLNSTGATTMDFTVTATAASIGATNSVGFGIYTVGNTQISIQPGGNTVATFNNGAGGACILQSYADSTTLQVKLLGGQTANLQTWTDASSAVLLAVTSAGFLSWDSTSGGIISSVSSNGGCYFGRKDLSNKIAFIGYTTASVISMHSTGYIGFSSVAIGGDIQVTDVAIYRNAAGILEINQGNGTAGTWGSLRIGAVSSGTVAQITRGAASQSANLTQWQNSSSTVLSSVDSAGLFLAPAGSFTAPSYAVSATNSGLFLSGTNEPGLTGGGGNTGLIVKANNSLQMGVQWGGVAAVLKVIDAGAGNTNRAGTPLSIKPGEGTGTGLAGFISMYASGLLGSGTTLQTNYEVMRFTTVASAANYIQATSNVSGTNPVLKAVGETNIGLTLQGSGTKGVTIGNALIQTEATLTDGATPALDASLGNQFYLAAAGNRTIAIPTNPVAGQKIIIRHFASGGARTLALNTGAGGFRFGSDITALTATSSGKTDYIACIYNITDSFWDVVAYIKGF